jgi:hypothetical protein
MRVEDWQAVGVVCGAILAVLTLAGLLYKKLVLPVFRGVRRAIKRADEVADEILGDKAKRIPSLKEQLAAQAVQLAELADNQEAQARQIAEHLEWHAAPGGRPAKARPDPPNAVRPQQRGGGRGVP